MKQYHLLLILIISELPLNLYSQNIELIGKSNSIKVSGGVSSNQVYYATSDTNSKRDPYSTVLSGNVSFQIYEWSLPLSFTWSNKNYNFQQPFNRYSLNPKYKWITAHIGYTSLSFSPYSLNGQIFTGAGIDITPNSWLSVSALYGRFQKTILFDSLHPANTKYLRKGFGLKTQCKLPQNDKISGEAGFTVFHAKDREHSIKLNNLILPVLDSLSISPKENMVLGTQFNFTLFKKVQINGEYAKSAITKDLLDTCNFNRSFIVGEKLFRTNSSTEIFNAYKTNISWIFSEYNFGVGYERVDPGYNTLGAYYFVNDLENITLNASGSFVKKRISANGSIGRQRDNLNNEKSSSMNRWVSSVSLNCMISKKLNLAASYSSFQSYTNIQSKIMKSYQQVNPFAIGDTLDYTQISQSANMNITYSFSSNENSRKSLMMNFAWQASSQKQKSSITPGTKFYNCNTAYAYSIAPIALNLTFSINSVINKAPGITNIIIGPSLSGSKAFLNKQLRTTLSISENFNYIDKKVKSRISTIRSSGSYVLNKKHNLNLSLAFLNRLSKVEKAASNSDFTATLGYSYSF